MNIALTHKKTNSLWIIFHIILISISLLGFISSILLLAASHKANNNFLRSANVTVIFTIDILLFSILKLFGYIFNKKKIFDLQIMIIFVISFLILTIFFAWENPRRQTYITVKYLYLTILFEYIVICFFTIYMILSILCFKNKKINKIICKTNEIISALTFISAGVLSLIAALLTIYLNKGKDFVDGDSYEKFKSASTLIADITIVIYFFIDTVIIPIIKENLIEFLNDTTTNTKGKKGKL